MLISSRLASLLAFLLRRVIGIPYVITGSLRAGPQLLAVNHWPPHAWLSSWSKLNWLAWVAVPKYTPATVFR